LCEEAVASCVFCVAGCSFARHETEAAEGNAEHVGDFEQNYFLI